LTVRELVARFPEIPQDLHGEPILSRFAEVFGELLRAARTPSACATQLDAANHYYLKLIGPMSIYGYGLATRERVLADLKELLDGHEADPQNFAASLLPKHTADREVRGPGCA
jgi:hypothetical protein